MGDMNGLGAVFSGFSSLGEGIAQAGASTAQGIAQNSLYQTNADILEFQSEDALKRGEKNSKQVKEAGKRLIGTQRARLAAQGIEIDSGSALTVQEDTAAVTAEDALTVKNNAWREAWGFKVQSVDSRFKGKFAEAAGRATAGASLATGGLKAAGGILKGAYERFGK